MSSMITRRSVAVVLVCAGMAAGCAGVNEAARGFAGVSTRLLKEKRPEALRKVFPYDYATCYALTKASLLRQGAYLYAEEPAAHLIAFYASEQDTTPVGIFLQETGPAATQLEVASASTYAKEQIAKRVFWDLEDHPVGEETKGPDNATQGTGNQ